MIQIDWHEVGFYLAFAVVIVGGLALLVLARKSNGSRRISTGGGRRIVSRRDAPSNSDTVRLNHD